MRKSRTDRAGFTLIEILIVIVIIGLLASASLVAIGGARGFMRNTSAKVQLDDLNRALEIYHQKYGEYPPDCCADENEIRRHILKRWPKVLKNSDLLRRMIVDVLERSKSRPNTILLFWLAGRPDGDAYYGFYSDQNDPFGLDITSDEESDNSPREDPLMELTYTSDGKGGNYNNEGFVFSGQTVAYFRARNKSYYIGSDTNVTKYIEFGHDDFAVPYMRSNQWINPDSFQLILPGEDGHYFSCEKDGHHHHEEDLVLPRDLTFDALSDDEQEELEGVVAPLSTGDWDNITNFTNGATLESERE